MLALPSITQPPSSMSMWTRQLLSCSLSIFVLTAEYTPGLLNVEVRTDVFTFFLVYCFYLITIRIIIFYFFSAVVSSCFLDFFSRACSIFHFYSLVMSPFRVAISSHKLMTHFWWYTKNMSRYMMLKLTFSGIVGVLWVNDAAKSRIIHKTDALPNFNLEPENGTRKE